MNERPSTLIPSLKDAINQTDQQLARNAKTIADMAAALARLASRK